MDAGTMEAFRLVNVKISKVRTENESLKLRLEKAEAELAKAKIDIEDIKLKGSKP